MNETGYLLVTDTVPNDGSRDVTADLQRLIDENPNRTLFFPDGLYRISAPIITPADPTKSVSLKLADFAVIQADERWDSEEAMIRLGGSHPFNTIYVNGSNYSLSGGIIDGNSVASGVSIDSGRETAVRELAIKHTKIGLHIKHGANGNSSDADILGVHITGTGKPDSIGVLVESCDNTFSNMRIANVFYGVKFCQGAGGNALRYVHPLYTCDYTDYENCAAFMDLAGNNWYYICYGDQFGNGFRFGEHSGGCVLDGCMSYWYAARGEHQVALRCDGAFRSAVTNLKVGFRAAIENRAVLRTAKDGGGGFLQNLCLNHGEEATLGDETYRAYLRGTVL